MRVEASQVEAVFLSCDDKSAHLGYDHASPERQTASMAQRPVFLGIRIQCGTA